MELADEVRAALADGEPLGDPQSRDLLTRLLDALEDLEERLAEADVPARRAEAAELVDEARRARQRILRDLARRRHAARREVAQLQAGRDRLLESFAAIRETVDGSTRELNLALAEARLRAGEAGRDVDREDLPTAAALDAELELARLAGLPLVAPERDHEEPEPGSPPDVPDVPDVGDEEEAPDVVAVGASRTREPVQAIVEDGPDAEPQAEPAPTAVELVEQRAAQRLKRVLADEQNEVLDRLRQRDRRRTLTVDLLLGGDLDRIARYRDALLSVLVAGEDGGAEGLEGAGGGPDAVQVEAPDAVQVEAPDAVQVEAVASDAAEAIVRGTRSRVEALLVEAVEGRTVDEDRVVDGVRACFREWKTQWLVRLAADSVALAGAGQVESA